jgi:hypothetical protein
MTVPRLGVLLSQYALSLIAIGAAIEVGYVADVSLTGAALLEVVVSVFIVLLSTRRQPVNVALRIVSRGDASKRLKRIVGDLLCGLCVLGGERLSGACHR